MQYLPGNQSIEASQCSREYIQNQLVKNHTRDFKSKYTNFGPHRDDFKLLIHDQSVVEFCSRGQLRSLVLSLKLAQINYIETHTLKKPLLLLDDVFSELDKTRRKALLELAQDYQTFISTVEMGYFEDLGVDFTLFKL
jgi:DNA replication and repair protein RecF